MANLKELRNKISGIQSIRKVTAAMKLVASVKLRKAEQKAVSSKSYAQELKKILAGIHREKLEKRYELFDGRGIVHTETFVVFASDRGFCGSFNYVLSKKVIELTNDRLKSGIKVKIACAGSKVFRILRHSLPENVSLELVPDFYKGDQIFENAKKLAIDVLNQFNENLIDKVSLVYTEYHSAMKTNLKEESLIPISREENPDVTDTIFEPSVDEVLMKLLPYNLGIQIYQAVLESIASEQSSRMSSMDNATRNADEILSSLTIKYNRTRQYNITQELVEVVSGAEAIASE